MTKPELKMLEKLFAAEIESALNKSDRIFQSKSKLLPKLEADGLVKRVTRVIPADRSCPFSVKMSGWELTLAGNAAYFLTCSDDDMQQP